MKGLALRTAAIVVVLVALFALTSGSAFAAQGPSGRVEVLPTREDLQQQIDFQAAQVERAQQEVKHAGEALKKLREGTPERAEAQRQLKSAEAQKKLENERLEALRAALRNGEYQQQGKPTEIPVETGGEPEIIVPSGGLPGNLLLPNGGRTPPSPPAGTGPDPTASPTASQQGQAPAAPDPAVAQEAAAVALEARLRARSAEIAALAEQFKAATAKCRAARELAEAELLKQNQPIRAGNERFAGLAATWNADKAKAQAIVAALQEAQGRAERAPAVMDTFMAYADQTIKDCKGNGACKEAFAIVDGARQAYQRVNSMGAGAATQGTELNTLCSASAPLRAVLVELQGLMATRESVATTHYGLMTKEYEVARSLYQAIAALIRTAQGELNAGMATLTALPEARRATVSAALVVPTLGDPFYLMRDSDVIEYSSSGEEKGLSARVGAGIAKLDGDVQGLKAGAEAAVGVIQVSILETGAAFAKAKEIIARAEAHCAVKPGTGKPPTTLGGSEAPAGDGTEPGGGGDGFLNSFGNGVKGNAQQNAQNAGNNMQNQQTLVQAGNAGNPEAEQGQLAQNSGGADAGALTTIGAGQAALGQQSVGFGTMVAGQTADNIKNILTTFTTEVGTHGANEVINQLWPQTGGGSGGTPGGDSGGTGTSGGTTVAGGGSGQPPKPGGGSGGGGGGSGGGKPPKPPAGGGGQGTNTTDGGTTPNPPAGGTTTVSGGMNLTYYKLICQDCGKKIYMSDDGTTGSPGNCQACGGHLSYQSIGSTRPADYANPSFVAYKWTYPCDANVPGDDPKYLPCHKTSVEYWLYQPMSTAGRCPKCGWGSTIQVTPF